MAFAQVSAGNWSEDFEAFPAGQNLTEVEGWGGFAGFRGEKKPTALVVEGRGVDDSKALAISSAEPFRGDGFGLNYQLPAAYKNGVVWMQCKMKPPDEWRSGFYLDAGGSKGRTILGRVAGTRFENKLTKTVDLRWHCTWKAPHWRLYTLSKLDSERWFTVTARFELDSRMMAAWVDDQPLGEEAPMTNAEAPFARLHLGFGGSPEHPALIDDLTIGRAAPKGFSAPELLPKPEDGLLFRFAGVGDPQLGFGGYEADKIRFGLAVDQINRAGVERSLILGDMVHFNDRVEAYVDMAKLAEGFESPHFYVRGNHERIDLFKEHFNEKLDYSNVHKGVRFVVLDAVGNQVGLSEEQLTWVESEFSAAAKEGEEIILALHVSPWQNNKKGIGKYNQIGPGRDELRALMKKYQVLVCLSGHYHVGLLHGLEEETHYLVLGGTALVKAGTFAWCLFDVYPDRIVMHQKPLFFGYEKPGVTQVHGLRNWIPYEILKQGRPYVQQGPLTMQRHRPAK